MATIDGVGVERGEIFLPSSGVWSASLVPFDDTEAAEGQRVEIIVGDLVLSGTVATGGPFESGAGVYVIGGAAGWREGIARRFYSDDNGVGIEGLLRDLAEETGEAVEVSEELRGAVIGPAWTRPEGIASEALDAIAKPWRMRPDGVTVVGAGATATATADGIVSLRRYTPAFRRAIVEFPDDEVASVVPGSILDLADDIAFTVRAALISIAGGTIRARLTA